jgi:hypothetical protein
VDEDFKILEWIEWYNMIKVPRRESKRRRSQKRRRTKRGRRERGKESKKERRKILSLSLSPSSDIRVRGHHSYFSLSKKEKTEKTGDTVRRLQTD